MTPALSSEYAQTDTVWASSPAIELYWRDWGEDSVAFEASSGHLFQFDALSAAVMACFEDGPKTMGDVSTALAADLGPAADAEFLDAVRALVEEFHSLGWLEPIIDA